MEQYAAEAHKPKAQSSFELLLDAVVKLDDSAAAEAFAKLAYEEESSSKADSANSNASGSVNTGAHSLAVAATAQDDGGVTALMLACDKGKPVVSKALLDAGADPWRSMWGTGNRPAHFAAGCHASSVGAVACLEALALCADNQNKASKKGERKSKGVPAAPSASVPPSLLTPATATTTALGGALEVGESDRMTSEKAGQDNTTTVAVKETAAGAGAKAGLGGRGTLVNVPGFEASFSGASAGSGDLASALAAAGVQVDYSTLQNVQAPPSDDAVLPKASAAPANKPQVEGEKLQEENKPRGSLFMGADALNGHGDTPLMVAVAGGQLATATWLVTRMALESKLGSDTQANLSPWLDLLNFSGDSALSLAATHADPAAVDLLLKSGANSYCAKKAPAPATNGSKGRKGGAGKSSSAVEGLTDGLTPKGAELVGSMLQELKSGQVSKQGEGSGTSSGSASPDVPARDALAAAEWAVKASAGSPQAVQAAAARCVELIRGARAAADAAADAIALEAALEAEKEMSSGSGSQQKSKSNKGKKGKKKGAAGKRASSVESTKELDVIGNDDEEGDGDEDEEKPKHNVVVEPATKAEVVTREEFTLRETASLHGDDLSGWIAPRSNGKANKKGVRQSSMDAKSPAQLSEPKAATKQASNMTSSSPSVHRASQFPPTQSTGEANAAERSAFDSLVAKACFGRKSRSGSLQDSNNGSNDDDDNNDDDDDVAALVATLGLTPSDLWLEDPRALALQLSPTQLSCASQLLAERVAAVQDARVIQARMAALAEARNEALNEAEVRQSSVEEEAEDTDHRVDAVVEPTTPVSAPVEQSSKEGVKEVAAYAPWLNAPPAEPVD